MSSGVAKIPPGARGKLKYVIRDSLLVNLKKILTTKEEPETADK